MLELEHGKPLIFGKDRDKGIRLNGLEPGGRDARRDGVTEDDLLFHDETPRTRYLASCSSRMCWPEFPVPVGVFRRDRAADPRRADDRPDRRRRSRSAARATSRTLLDGGETWTVR